MGYLPTENGGEVVSRTLDYGFADYSTALAIQHVLDMDRSTNTHEFRGEYEDWSGKAQQLMERALRAVERSYDSGIGLMVPKDRHGRRSGRFSPVEWGNGFTEGNSWHHSFPAYAVSCSLEEGLGQCDGNSNRRGLASLHGGSAALLHKLEEMLKIPSNFQVGSYGQEIHEMTEMRAFAMGQYGHNNQPVHHILYLFNLVGDIAATQEHVREVLDRGYGVDFYAGDEDNGEMGSWYVLSALGMFVVTPGSDKYVVGSPLFRHVRIARRSSHGLFNLFALTNPRLDPAITASTKTTSSSTDEWLDIIALGNDNRVRTSQRIRWNQDTVVMDRSNTATYQQGVVLHDAQLQSHGLLQFFMTDTVDTTNEAKVVAEATLLHSLPTETIESMHSQRYLTDVVAASASASAKKSASIAGGSTASEGNAAAVAGVHAVHNHHGTSNQELIKRLRAAENYEKEQEALAHSSWSLVSPIVQIYMLMFVACLLACIASEILRTLLKQDRLVIDCIKDPIGASQRIPQLFRNVNWRPKHINHTV